tara:strand:- start:1273 stop:2913 length:1641 start_codon:yes stop_codon:yes gene_type:complete
MAREKPIPRSKRKLLNRGLLRSRNSDNVKNFSVGLMDIDSTIMYYFNNVIQPKVEENGELVKVPLMYSNPERWEAVQKKGFLLDNKKQLIVPLIAFKRSSIEKDTSLSVDKLNSKDPQLFYTFQKRYTNKNRYDKFSVQQGLNKTKELYTVAVPDYIKLTYEFVIWTSYIEQMNKLVEQIIYSEGSYWGEDGKFKFRTQIDSYTDASEVAVNTERLIKTTFSVTLNGYLIPEEFNNVVTTQKALTPKRIVINDGIGINIADLADGKKDVRISVKKESNHQETLANPFSIEGGVGVSIGGHTGLFDGSSPATFQLNIGQPVATTDEVQFASISASSALHIGSTSFEISQREDGRAQVNTDWVVLGDLIAENVRAENFIISSSTTYMTTSFSAGNTAFGDSYDDLHHFTGSVHITGSFNINGTTAFTAISNDTTLIDSSQSEVVTEHAIKTYVDTRDAYLRKQYVKSAASITVPSTASFTAITASAPTELTATSEHDFVFFINGQYMEHDAISIQQAGSSLLVKVDNGSIGYDLEADDEIIAQGKFNS